MMLIDDLTLREYIRSDLPYLDLGNEYLQKYTDTNREARLIIFTREDLTLCAAEEAVRIAEILQCKKSYFLPSGSAVLSGDTVLQLQGSFENLHKAWRLIQSLLEFSSKMASYTAAMVKEVKSANPNCELLTTRKSFPFAKEICIKSIRCGGAFPHRLGLSESILLFENHRKAFAKSEDFYNALLEMKKEISEKRVIVETGIRAEAKQLMDFGVDGLQLERLHPEDIKELVDYRNEHTPATVLMATGGIRLENVRDYAATGVDAIVTGAPYQSGAADMGSRLEML